MKIPRGDGRLRETKKKSKAEAEFSQGLFRAGLEVG